MSQMSSEVVSSQIKYGQSPQNWKVFQPPKYPLISLIAYGICFIVMCPLLCTADFGLVLTYFGQEQLLQSSFWPMYTT